ncbi:hypothetical protein [Pseudomonas sp. H1h]|uniref:hypothetical protein n=1 Tax=Pseudomonas sp. H1h TaxID=1397280 RepID=UPI000469926A|nr:hypothetical protein [Pseudomonas sp. H1h]
MSDYFSDRRNGPRARTEQVISPTVRAGRVAAVQALINSGAFGLRFPERCPDGQATCGGDAGVLATSVSAEMPGLVWPLAPDTLLVLGFIEFVHASLAKPISGKYHDYFRDHHLTCLVHHCLKAGSCSPIPFRNLFGGAGFAALERRENLFDAEKN